MRISAAITQEQGVTFTVLLVKNGVINSSKMESVRDGAPINFPRPVILAEQKAGGRMQYHGRNDIVKFLSNIPYSALPWKEYTV